MSYFVVDSAELKSVPRAHMCKHTVIRVILKPAFITILWQNDLSPFKRIAFSFPLPIGFITYGYTRLHAGKYPSCFKPSYFGVHKCPHIELTHSYKCMDVIHLENMYICLLFSFPQPFASWPSIYFSFC